MTVFYDDLNCLDAAEDMNNGPEDLFLEELVRNLKWKAAQKQQATHFRQRQQPQLTDIRLLDEDDYAEQDDKVLFQPRIEQPFQQQRREEQKNFAYRPHDDRFRNNQHRPPVEPVRQIKTINPLIQSAGTRIFFFLIFPLLFPSTKEAILRNTKVAEHNSQPAGLF